MRCAVMRMSTAARISILMTSAMTRIEDIVEWTSAEEFSENFLGITEHERKAAEDEVAVEHVVLVSSTMVVSVACVVVS